MKIATWNVNSVKSRLEHLTRYLTEKKPDVMLLQELKCMDEAFPYLEIGDLGYNIELTGQKTYNGVAILSKHPIEDVTKKLPGDDTDEDARYIEGFTNGVRVVSVYVPNGMDEASHKFQYKLRFLERLRAHFKTILAYDEKFVAGGDYNVAPFPVDVHNPRAMDGSICYHPLERRLMNSIRNLGVIDAYRAANPNTQKFSWWDYRAGAWQNNLGMRIDHLLLSPEAADALVECDIDTEPRGWEKPSDHTPVWCELK